MADTTRPMRPSFDWRRIDCVILTIAAVFVALAFLDADQVLPTADFAVGAFARTAPILAFAVLAIGYVKAAGVETLVGRAFQGREVPMILLAATVGSLSPFCSCQVIPFIAALLAVGAPLSAVMAFWLASPLMDPAMFVLTGGVLGLDFAIAKTLAAVAIGIMGGFTVRAFAGGAVFADPLKQDLAPRTCCGKVKNPFQGQPEYRFWREPARRGVFARTVWENAFFLGKWLALAYTIEALMVTYVPAEVIARFMGGTGLMPILTGAVLGAPAYLNGYAAVPLMAALIEQGMAQGAAMSFVVAGGMSSIPAAIAVWALVKPRVFAAYLGFAFTGAILSGIAWGLWSGGLTGL
ncbi:permease [Rhodobaculum claviforme]|uniref:Permease n=1 Tax=Rhodobaculum claviforme TaxID=1549854 RepID=A0A934TK96_9RHOB|nr:permease [Rhodobaculum claviforme]MBK5927158.1 permease [Rhodobaculum claviforme]